MLFDNNLGFITFDLDNKRPNTSNEKFLDYEEGFLRGNMAKDEYKSYKNYTYFKLTPNSKKEELLYEVMALNFAINDLALYLDLHPDNSNVNNLFNRLVVKKCEKELEYVNMYGPLELEESSKEKYTWGKDPWPWNEKGGSMYV